MIRLDTQPDPETLRAEIPDAMQQARRWLLWRAEGANGAGKPRKVPYYADGTPRRGSLDGAEDMARLARFQEILGALEGSGFAGVGFALGPDGDGNHWQGIDLDGTDARPELLRLVELLPGYVERSPSGKGYHALGIGRAFEALAPNESGIEAYARGRYFTVTGDAVGGNLEDLSGFVTTTLAPLHRGSHGTRERAQDIEEGAPIREGARNTTLTSLAGTMRRRGFVREAIEAALLAENAARCKLPLRDEDVRVIARSVARYQPAERAQQTQQEVAEQLPSPPPPEDLDITDAELAVARLHPRCIVEHHTYADVAQVAAPGGTGKTTLLLYEAVCIALGLPLWGLKVEAPGWTLFVTAEDRREQIVARIREIKAAMDVSAEELATLKRSVRVWDVAGVGLALVRNVQGSVALTTLADNIVNAYWEDPPAVVIFDPLVSFGASESLVNDNEQGIVTAARRIVRGLDCCVRVIHHTGKANARERTLDQYSGRGGSAMADGSRMTTVLQVWNAHDDKSKLRPPAGCIPSHRSSITILSRAKLSYSPPGLPLIWIKRTGFTFEHFVDIPVAPEQARAAKADQLERFLTHQIGTGRYHNKSSLDSQCGTLQMSRQELRDALTELQISGRVVDEDLPKEQKHGARKTYLRPVDVADPFGEMGAEKPVSPPPISPVLITSPPYRERTGGEITPPVSPPAPCISPQGNGDIRRDWRDGEEVTETEEPEVDVFEL